MCAITRSPGMKPCTPSPTCLTTPAISLPGEKGRSGLNWYLFWMRRTSGKFTPLAFTDTKSCPLPGFGEGMSSTTSASGGPHVLHRTAFTRVLLRACRHHSRLVASATIVGLPCSVPRGGFHDRNRDIARAAIRGLLDAAACLLRRRAGPRRRASSFDDCTLRGRLSQPARRRIRRLVDLHGRSERRRGKSTGSSGSFQLGDCRPARHQGASCIDCRDDRVLAVPRRDAGENVAKGKDCQGERSRSAVTGQLIGRFFAYLVSFIP